ncbi:hypothetical protein GW746_02325 [Candidatus Saccharibacteria bacterium]|nr:hypothetical protein [Candidatus Saccharibacteria bacterium]
MEKYQFSGYNLGGGDTAGRLPVDYFSMDIDELDLSGKPQGPHVAKELIKIASELPSSTIFDGWNVPLCPDRAQVHEYVPHLRGYTSVLEHDMHQKGFHGDAAQYGSGWLLNRYIDRLHINNKSYAEARYQIIPMLTPFEVRSKEGIANPAERLLLRYGNGAPNIELARITAPDYRMPTRQEKREIISQTVEALGGERVDEPKEVAVDEYAYVNGDTLVRFHEKDLLAVMPDETKLARRLGIVAQLAGTLSDIEITDCVKSGDVYTEAGTKLVTQSEIDYAYNKSTHINGGYSTGL